RPAPANPRHVAWAVSAPAQAQAKAACGRARHGLAPWRCRDHRRGVAGIRYGPDQRRWRRQEEAQPRRRHRLARVVAGAGERRDGCNDRRRASGPCAEGGAVARAADVRRGRGRRGGEGIATLAALSGRPVVPFAIATRRFLALPTWRRLTDNLPFATMAIVIGDPVRVAASNDVESIEA